MRLKDIVDFNVLNFQTICTNIRHGRHFALARFGDGEFNAIMGFSGYNCDGHAYYKQMGADLAQVLKNKPEYFLGIHQDQKIEKETIFWLNANNVEKLRWVNNAVFHDAMVGKDNNGKRTIVIPRLFQHFWDAANAGPSKIAIIAPGYIREQQLIGVDTFLEIPGHQTYLSINDIKADIDRLNLYDHLVLICASMTAPLLVDHLFSTYGNRITAIDFGSCFDPYVGKQSRSFHQRMK